MKVWEKVKDFLMPEETIELDDLEDTMVAAEEPKAVVNGPVYSTPQSFVKPEPVVPKTPKPVLKMHTNKVPELKINIYMPESFDEVMHIADDYKSNKGCVVNYEKLKIEEQRRICDFMNGVCYVLDGEAKRISATMVLYVPNGVDVGNVPTNKVRV